MPMTLFEYEPNYILTKRVFSLEAKDAEQVFSKKFSTRKIFFFRQIAVEDLAGDGSAGQEFGAAIRLYHRVKILKKYLEDVNSGVLPHDPEITRQANAMLSQLPSSPANQISTSQTGLKFDPHAVGLLNLKRYNFNYSKLACFYSQAFLNIIVKISILFRERGVSKVQVPPKAPLYTLPFTTALWLKNFLDYSLISSLATVTEGSQSLQQLLARFDILHDKPGQKQRIRGLFI